MSTAGGKVVMMPFAQSRDIKREVAVKVASLCEFGPDHDVVAELRNNRDAYTVSLGDDSSTLSMLTFPRTCIDAVDVLRTRVKSGSKPGTHSTIACCISYGVQYIQSDLEVKQLIALKERFDSADENADGAAVEMIGQWFHNFDMVIDLSGRRVNVKLPISIYGNLADLAHELGLPIYILGVVATLIALVIQPGINRESKEKMERVIASFFRLVKLRVASTEALMQVFQL